MARQTPAPYKPAWVPFPGMHEAFSLVGSKGTLYWRGTKGWWAQRPARRASSCRSRVPLPPRAELDEALVSVPDIGLLAAPRLGSGRARAAVGHLQAAEEEDAGSRAHPSRPSPPPASPAPGTCSGRCERLELHHSSADEPFGNVDVA